MLIKREATLKTDKYNAIGIGPGIGTDDEMAEFVKQFVQNCKQPLLLDADALNILSKEKEWQQLLPADTVITPHPKEFDRLFGESKNDFERMQKAIDATYKHSVVIVLKGHYTLVANKGKGYFNTTGNVGMATGGILYPV